MPARVPREEVSDPASESSSDEDAPFATIYRKYRPNFSNPYLRSSQLVQKPAAKQVPLTAPQSSSEILKRTAYHHSDYVVSTSAAPEKAQRQTAGTTVSGSESGYCSMKSSSVRIRAPPLHRVRPTAVPASAHVDRSNALQASSSRHTLATDDTVAINGKTYEVLNTLGKGGSSQVYQIFDPETRQCLALKCVYLSSADDSLIQIYKNEIRLLTQLRGSPSVINMFDHEFTSNGRYLLMILEKGDTDLESFMRSRTGKPSLAMIAFYWMEMLKAVKTIHDQGIVHADLKPANFLLIGGNLKLIDFGISVLIPEDQTCITNYIQMGTLSYISPEAISSEDPADFKLKVSCKSDVWSLGCILYRMVYGKTPFQDIPTTAGKLNAIINPTVPIEFPDPGNKNLVDVMKLCLKRNPRERPSVQELITHPFCASDPTDVHEDEFVRFARDLLQNSPMSAVTKLKAFCNEKSKPKQSASNSNS